MKSQLLREIIERHRRILRCPHVHVLAGRQDTRIGSRTVGGHVLLTRTEPLGSSINCTVDAEVLSSLLGGNHDVSMQDDGASLVVRCGPHSGSVPSQSEEPPLLPSPSPGSSTNLSSEDVEDLRSMLKRTSLGKTRDEGCTSITGDGRQMCVCTYDDVHGAFAWTNSTCRVSAGLLPSDAALFLRMMEDGRVAVSGTADNRLFVRNATDALALPCVQTQAMPRETVYGSTRLNWELGSASEFLDGLRACQAVAKAKDAGPVRISTEGNRITLSADSPAGTVRRVVPAKARGHAPVLCNAEILRDVADRLDPDQPLQGWLEPGDQPSPRLVLRASGSTYVLLTSSG